VATPKATTPNAVGELRERLEAITSFFSVNDWVGSRDRSPVPMKG
jgi:hypothetical protein